MSLVSVPEAARRLGVDESRVRQRIADGSLRAERLGRQWVVDDADLAPIKEAQPGRPISSRSAWALAAAAAAYPDKSSDRLVSASDRLLARKRLANLLAEAAADRADGEQASHRFAAHLRALMANRAERRLYRASPRDLPDLREDDRLSLSGLSDPASGIASGDLVEGYVAEKDASALAEDYLLSEARPSEANVVLHVVPAAAPVPQIDSAWGSWLLLAADLAEHRGPREEARACSILRDVAAASDDRIEAE